MVVLERTHMDVKRRHCCVKVTSSRKIASKGIQGLLEVYFYKENSGKQEKESIIHVRVG